ncbi:MAG: hypothetical protein K9N23_09160 [Akkermansiaceae bacterium]|nr:hypothetical protein [Akkermansiaceae bacterium]
MGHNPYGKAQWVVLRGTANLQNMVDDLEFVGRGEHELGINVHSGFAAALQECLPWMLQRLDKTRPTWVTVHSLGGAVAALLVATLDHRGFKEVSGITFGQPKFAELQRRRGALLEQPPGGSKVGVDRSVAPWCPPDPGSPRRSGAHPERKPAVGGVAGSSAGIVLASERSFVTLSSAKGRAPPTCPSIQNHDHRDPPSLCRTASSRPLP